MDRGIQQTLLKIPTPFLSERFTACFEVAILVPNLDSDLLKLLVSRIVDGPILRLTSPSTVDATSLKSASFRRFVVFTRLRYSAHAIAHIKCTVNLRFLTFLRVIGLASD